MRKLIVVVLASFTFGGVIGALATAATQSQASPQAIAAAVQRVQDQSADRTLAAISGKLGALSGMATTLTNVFDQTRDTQSDVDAVGPLASELFTVENELYGECVQTASNPTLCQLPISPDFRRDAR